VSDVVLSSDGHFALSGKYRTNYRYNVQFCFGKSAGNCKRNRKAVNKSKSLPDQDPSFILDHVNN
jgi:hypothetical protein